MGCRDLVGMLGWALMVTYRVRMQENVSSVVAVCVQVIGMDSSRECVVAALESIVEIMRVVGPR